jgi:uncharacterized protein YggE
MKTHRIIPIVMLIVFCCAPVLALAQVEPPPRPDREPRFRNVPTLTVSGQAETSVKPDRAFVQLGAVAQAEQAAEAQKQVNEMMNRALEAIRNVGVADDLISTVGISLHPVYADQRVPVDRPAEPRIVGFRASNSLRIQLDDLTKVGDVIDAGTGAGANHIENISFTVRDDTAARARALGQAAQNARAKADEMAKAMNLRIEGVLEITEGGADVFPVRMGRAVAAMEAAGAPTPVQPGQVQVHARVNVTYRVAPADGD